MAWRVAKCLDQLLKELKEEFPNRDRGSDGALGNQEHQTRHSDHNPDENGVVRARDYDEDLDGVDHIAIEYYSADMEKVVQHLLTLARAGDTRFNPDGYLIYEKRIWSAAKNWVERKYTGANEHKHHVHYSCSSDPVGYNRIDSYGIKKLFEAPVILEEWMQDCYFMITPDGGGIIVFKGIQGKLCQSANQFNLLVAMGWAKAYNPANDQEHMQPDIYEFLTR